MIGPVLFVMLLGYAMLYSGVRHLQGKQVSTIGALLGADEPPIDPSSTAGAGAPAGGRVGPAALNGPNPAASSIVGAARQYVGRPYRLGAPGVAARQGPVAGPLDCSGLTMQAYLEGAGVQLPHSAALQATQCVRLSAAQAGPGDLAFYTHASAVVFHVAIIVDAGSMIEAAPSHGVGIVARDYQGAVAFYGRPKALVGSRDAARHGKPGLSRGELRKGRRP